MVGRPWVPDGVARGPPPPPDFSNHAPPLARPQPPVFAGGPQPGMPPPPPFPVAAHSPFARHAPFQPPGFMPPVGGAGIPQQFAQPPPLPPWGMQPHMHPAQHMFMPGGHPGPMQPMHPMNSVGQVHQMRNAMQSHQAQQQWMMQQQQQHQQQQQQMQMQQMQAHQHMQQRPHPVPVSAPFDSRKRQRAPPGGQQVHAANSRPGIEGSANAAPAKKPKPDGKSGGAKAGTSGKNPDLDVVQEIAQKLGARIPGDAPEEVEKWIAARRANWPSKANVERRKQEAAAREERGEGRRSAPRKSLKDAVSGKRRNDRNAERAKKTSAAAYAVETKGEAAAAAGALGALAAQYAGGSSDDDKGSSGEVVEASNRSLEEREEARPQRQGNGPGKPKRNNNGRRARRAAKAKGGDGRNGHAQLKPLKPTLLELLLEPEIREEQNLLLQCIRVLVNENFFQREEGDSEGSDGDTKQDGQDGISEAAGLGVEITGEQLGEEAKDVDEGEVIEELATDATTTRQRSDGDANDNVDSEVVVSSGTDVEHDGATVAESVAGTVS